MIGYGAVDSEVIGVDRCSGSGELALAIQTLEANING